MSCRICVTRFMRASTTAHDTYLYVILFIVLNDICGQRRDLPCKRWPLSKWACILGINVFHLGTPGGISGNRPAFPNEILKSSPDILTWYPRMHVCLLRFMHTMIIGITNSTTKFNLGITITFSINHMKLYLAKIVWYIIHPLHISGNWMLTENDRNLFTEILTKTHKG